MNSLSNGNSHGEAHRAIGSTERRYSSLQSLIAPAEVLSQAVPAHLHLGAASDRIISRFTVKISRERCGPRSGYAHLFPIRLYNAVMETDTAWAASLRRLRHIGDFRQWKDHDAYRKGFERLMRDLQ